MEQGVLEGWSSAAARAEGEGTPRRTRALPFLHCKEHGPESGAWEEGPVGTPGCGVEGGWRHGCREGCRNRRKDGGPKRSSRSRVGTESCCPFPERACRPEDADPGPGTVSPPLPAGPGTSGCSGRTLPGPVSGCRSPAGSAEYAQNRPQTPFPGCGDTGHPPRGWLRRGKAPGPSSRGGFGAGGSPGASPRTAPQTRLRCPRGSPGRALRQSPRGRCAKGYRGGWM